MEADDRWRDLGWSPRCWGEMAHSAICLSLRICSKELIFVFSCIEIVRDAHVCCVCRYYFERCIEYSVVVWALVLSCACELDPIASVFVVLSFFGNASTKCSRAIPASTQLYNWIVFGGAPGGIRPSPLGCGKDNYDDRLGSQG